MSALSGERLIDYIANKNFGEIGKRLGLMALFTLLYLPAFLPIYAPQLFFGQAFGEATGFSQTHRILIYICVSNSWRNSKFLWVI